ncbi:hypothetical protein CARUB_v10021420mg [Capsella rubella]|uniref:WRKY domain-containing protein n=1 Tax=Capsella rubella TaxID=81985 RepID=R0GDS1_9BRAS|nr:hypothetical protein CARUB_v10021420mg [Capsella rubella]
MFSNIDHKALAALLHGQGCANNLKTLLDNREISSVLIEPLINTILDSFSLALSFVDSPTPPQLLESSSCQNMAALVHQRSSKKDHESPNPRPDDGFAWRKYGQKTIKTSVHQRSYYRCAYAKDRNCNATKRVQMIKDSPPVFRTSYMGQHTCKAFEVYDETYGSEMIQFDQVKSELVMPTSTDHQAITIDDKARDHTMNQGCDINDFLVDYDQFWQNEFPSFSYGDTVFS